MMTNALEHITQFVELIGIAILLYGFAESLFLFVCVRLGTYL